MKTETLNPSRSNALNSETTMPAFWQRNLIAFFRTPKDVSGLILRLSLAIVIFPHGAQKVFGWYNGFGLEQTIAFFTQMGMPLPISLAVIAAEFLGPIALVAGFFTRWSAFGLGIVMIGAAQVAIPHGFFMNWMGQQKGEGIEFFIPVLGIALVLMIKGGGLWAVDRLIAAKIDAGRS